MMEVIIYLIVMAVKHFGYIETFAVEKQVEAEIEQNCSIKTKLVCLCGGEMNNTLDDKTMILEKFIHSFNTLHSILYPPR